MNKKREIESPFIEESVIYIDDIPLIRLRPKIEREKYSTIIFYHGWSSSKDSQRMRGYILSSLGFQVLIPDSINHGRRNPIDYMNPISMKDYFWPTVLKSIEESEKIIEYGIERLDIDEDNIGVSGHSMGGFISSGIFTHNKKVKAGVILNGSCNWNYCNELIATMIGEALHIPVEDELKKIQDKLINLDPILHMERSKDRPLLMINGGSDNVVPMEGQKIFYEEARKKYINKSLIDFIVYKDLGHFVTSNMMEDTGKWFKKFL